MLEDPALRRRFGQAGRRTIEDDINAGARAGAGARHSATRAAERTQLMADSLDLGSSSPSKTPRRSSLLLDGLGSVGSAERARPFEVVLVNDREQPRTTAGRCRDRGGGAAVGARHRSLAQLRHSTTRCLCGIRAARRGPSSRGRRPARIRRRAGLRSSPRSRGRGRRVSRRAGAARPLARHRVADEEARCSAASSGIDGRQVSGSRVQGTSPRRVSGLHGPSATSTCSHGGRRPKFTRSGFEHRAAAIRVVELHVRQDGGARASHADRLQHGSDCNRRA